MSVKNQILVLILFLSASSIMAQDKGRFSLTFEYGAKNASSTLNDNWAVRQDVGAYSSTDYGVNNRVDVRYSINSFGIKPEYGFFDNKLWVSSGIRFTKVSAEMMKFDYDEGGYFFLRYKSEGTTTEYAKVNKINEHTNYIGVPLELSFSPFWYRNFDFYAKIGAELGFKLSSKTNIEFRDAAMAGYEQTVIDNVGVSVNSYYSTVYGSIGAKYHLSNKLNCSFEVLLPIAMLTKNNSSLVELSQVAGVQFSLSVPLK